MGDNPKASSTPKVVPSIKSRKPIHHDQSSIQSPIEKLKPEQSSSDDEEFQSINNETKEKSPVLDKKKWNREEVLTYNRGIHPMQRRSSKKFTISQSPQRSFIQEPAQTPPKRTSINNQPHKSIADGSQIVLYSTIIMILICMLTAYTYISSSSNENNNNPWKKLKSIAKEYSAQQIDFWDTIEVLIEEVHKRGQPKSLVFAYTEGNYQTAHEIVEKISKHATCVLSYCNKSIVELHPSDLNTDEVLKDYGRIISRARAPLQESGVMVVENLEKVAGTSAQAFHSLCDEYNPVIGKALFLFTVKIDKLPASSSAFPAVRDRLRTAWWDLKEDIFHPLITRIASVVLPVMSEH